MQVACQTAHLFLLLPLGEIALDPPAPAEHQIISVVCCVLCMVYAVSGPCFSCVSWFVP